MNNIQGIIRYNIGNFKSEFNPMEHTSAYIAPNPYGVLCYIIKKEGKIEIINYNTQEEIVDERCRGIVNELTEFYMNDLVLLAKIDFKSSKNKYKKRVKQAKATIIDITTYKAFMDGYYTTEFKDRCYILYEIKRFHKFNYINIVSYSTLLMDGITSEDLVEILSYNKQKEHLIIDKGSMFGDDLIILRRV